MRFIDVLLAPIVALLSLAGAPAIGAGAERSPASGSFAIELDGPNKGQVKSADGGKATAAKTKEHPASAPQKKSPRAATPPRPAAGTVQPLCPTPPCYLKNGVETKKK